MIGGLIFVSNELTPKTHAEYGEIISIIERARENAFRAVNRELITMYWDIGGYVSEKVRHGGWGTTVVEDFARFIQAERPDIKGFSASNIWRMRQDVPENHKEKELRKSIVANIRDFILEFGKDFTFVGDEYRVQVGNKDFHIDLLFYNRELSCLVAIELKVTDFKPEHLGQLEFYLEALDRDVRKPNENPSVGLILCAGKDDMVVEYALSRSLSPALVADYQLHLPNKTLLTAKLRELKELADVDGDEDDEEI
jgi:predicted nuclease of restriction endonuclease-like (RecB) superfamily